MPTDDEISPDPITQENAMPAVTLAPNSPFHPARRRSSPRPAFAVIDGGCCGRDTEDPPPIVDQAPRWWRMIVVLSLRYGRRSVVGWPLYAVLLAWRSYDAKCVLDALTLRYGRGDEGFDIGLKISEILRHGASIEDLRVIENATHSSRFRPFGLEATFADETTNGASLLHHMNWACGLVRSPIPDSTNP